MMLSVLYYSVYWAVILVTIFIVILDNRHPVKTMAWILVLVFLPVIGLFLYFFLGRSTKGVRIISKSGQYRLTERPMQAYQTQASLPENAGTEKLRSYFRKVNSALTFGGNSVDIFTDGYSMLHSLLREIHKARHHIHLQFYIFEDDATGRLLRDALVDKVREGVKVRILYDDVGCWKVDKMFYDGMRCEGIEVVSFLKVRFPQFTGKVNYRCHRKIAVIDGKVGFIGGMNIADRYLKGVPWGNWRDTHVKIEGRGVYGLQTAFLTDWYAMYGTMLTAPEYFPPAEDCGSSIVQVVTAAPVGKWQEIMHGLVTAVANAKRYFYVQTPYFLPTAEVMSALQTAALSGVDVRVMIPKRADAFFIHKGSLSYLDDLMAAGVKVYLYKHGFLHSKLWVWDDGFSSVGSTNMDFRSFEHNFEANAFFYDSWTALRLKSVFLHDQRRCLLLTRKIWAKRSWKNKVTESVVRLFAPLL